jgi:hypothetical protein
VEFFTKPREIEPRFSRDGDQLAVFATHYDDAHPVTPVRTTDLAKMGEPLITWVTLLADPELKHGTGGVFLLTFASPPNNIITMQFKEREQVVVRESLQVDPWDLPAECLKAVEGSVCYLPRQHVTPCDPESDATAVPERVAGDDLGALADAIRDAA